MGRTIPSYRLASEGEKSNWDEILRKRKVKEKKKDFALRKKLKRVNLNKEYLSC
jgi:hypothetical protein